jgi:hypothetical protein
MAAGDAEPVGVVGRNQPVAHVVLGIGAEAERTARIRQSRPGLADPLDGAEVLNWRREAQLMPAALAVSVLEVEGLPAKLAFKQLHTSSTLFCPLESLRVTMPLAMSGASGRSQSGFDKTRVFQDGDAIAEPQAASACRVIPNAALPWKRGKQFLARILHRA